MAISNLERRKNKKALEARSLAFRKTLNLYGKHYDAETLYNFYEYWSEPDRDYKLMRFEMEKTWNLPHRLERWEWNSERYKYR